MNEFEQRVALADEKYLHATAIDVLQVNLGLRCNMSCAHCHQSCSPTRSEVMDRQTIAQVIRAADMTRPRLVDLTGGAPELHPDLRLLLMALHELGIPTQLRTNLTALMEPEAEGLIELLRSLEVHILASLHGMADDGEYAPAPEALAALRMLSAAGYGRDPRLRLDVAICPNGPYLVTDSHTLESRVREAVTDHMDIPFDSLVILTNMPVGRFRERLVRDDELDTYLAALADEFNAETLPELWCRTGLEVAWDGSLSDCDFNLGRGMRTHPDAIQHVAEFDVAALASRRILFADHCLSCTAHAGSG